MGMYTKVNLCLPIKKDTNNNILQVLDGMFQGDEIADLKEKGLTIPDHIFFKTCSRVWFPNSVGSYYFTGTSNSNIKYDTLRNYAMVLHIDSDSKIIYEDIDNFLEWICPYLDFSSTGFLGYSLYEEDLDPILYWWENNSIVKFKNKNMEKK